MYVDWHLLKKFVRISRNLDKGGGDSEFWGVQANEPHTPSCLEAYPDSGHLKTRSLFSHSRPIFPKIRAENSGVYFVIFVYDTLTSQAMYFFFFFVLLLVVIVNFVLVDDVKWVNSAAPTSVSWAWESKSTRNWADYVTGLVQIRSHTTTTHILIHCGEWADYSGSGD